MYKYAYSEGVRISIAEYDKETNPNITCSLGHKLVAKKGNIMVHHFAHYPGEKCDPWRQGMTNWHHQWQRIIKDKDCLEVVMKDADNHHIADIVSIRKDQKPLVIEIQHSPIKADVIKERDKFYGNMIWLFDWTPRLVKEGLHTDIVFNDGTIQYYNKPVSFKLGILARNNSYYIAKVKTKYWFASDKPTYYDCGFGILYKLFDLDKSCYFCSYMKYERFIEKFYPELDEDEYSSSTWFKSLEIDECSKVNLIPQWILCNEITIVGKESMEIKGEVDKIHPLKEFGFKTCEGGLIYGSSKKKKPIPVKKSAYRNMSDSAAPKSPMKISYIKPIKKG